MSKQVKLPNRTGSPAQVLIDDRANEGVKDAAATQWDTLSPCCGRPGMVRTLRRQHTCARDLSQSHESGFLKGLVCSARVTVADCELRHARNRTFTSSTGRTGYTSFCVSSILDESKLLHSHSLGSAASRDCVQKATGLLQEFFNFLMSILAMWGFNLKIVGIKTEHESGDPSMSGSFDHEPKIERIGHSKQHHGFTTYLVYSSRAAESIRVMNSHDYQCQCQ